MNAYMISVRPCGPAESRPASPAGVTTAIAESTRMPASSASTANIASFISLGPIFLPRYSGVRPTIRPAMNTARIAKTSMP